jgi:hypothetical protein
VNVTNTDFLCVTPGVSIPLWYWRGEITPETGQFWFCPGKRLLNDEVIPGKRIGV